MAAKKYTLALVLETCATFNAKQNLVDALTEILKPKSAGAVVNVDEVTQKDASGWYI